MLAAKHIQLHGRLQNISLNLAAGEVVHILGPNGAGKSSLLSVLAGLLTPNSGDVQLKGKKLQDYSLVELAHCRTLMEQQLHSAFALSVQESLSFYSQRPKIPPELEHALEITDFLSRPLNHLSGGERRRVQLCRSLMQIWTAIEQGNALILLDEPVQGLDFAHQHKLCQLINLLATHGNMVVVSHHQLNLAQMYAHRVWLMSSQQLVADGLTADVLQQETLERVFQCRVRIAFDSEQNKLIQTYLDY
ncbi:ATP-binding cassette domain-containing protein [Bowmanella yangjiangensis]|uniref:ATP-binding cassette domain-containing protein n=1 Tax=Bowmanella yangjiangensis TaxID=2811230 RepID=A0ABS3CU63_9ALTE|nr:ATP-binding cassette domain-containing protein [Bowmanella yangjiangensis]MBN7820671.1 ATP-binding cassette domain-containing protein [Bowmanella yangjiangensis]